MTNQVTAPSSSIIPMTYPQGGGPPRGILSPVESATAILGNCQEHQTQRMGRKKSKQRSLAVLLDLVAMAETSFSWLLSPRLYLPDANSVSESTAVQRQVESTLNEFILDVRVQFPTDQLPAEPGTETCIICELLHGPDPRPCYRSDSSQAEHSPHSPASDPPSCSHSGSYSIRGTGGGRFCWEQLPAPDGSVHLPAQLSPCWLPSYRVFLFVQSASYCSIRQHSPSPHRSMLSRILRQTESKRPHVPGSVQKNPFPPDTASMLLSCLLVSLCRRILALK